MCAAGWGLPVTVVLTGATGFLGLHLLRGPLARHDRVAVLARGEPSTVLGRLAGFCGAAVEPAEAVAALPDRVRVIQGAVAEPCLGLPTPAYRRLAGGTDELCHSAGNTTPDGDLARLRRVNVAGTRNALASAGAGRPALFHVCTAFVAGRRRYGTVDDDGRLDRRYLLAGVGR
jgi:thioester reductase-like protein